ncbi:hypothetical protein CYMTET_15235 [Cymbomonas tetramitiformis]|uniref:Uncharacterized protein n=1 Tax=Cymbomonas tetramitiformis TaxID=36881 RepID=A0AAE0GES1_9CHLO|nr:hypothetical protein CYMTET_15235 [Cymbomonas tetramitiformis]
MGEKLSGSNEATRLVLNTTMASTKRAHFKRPVMQGVVDVGVTRQLHKIVAWFAWTTKNNLLFYHAFTCVSASDAETECKKNWGFAPSVSRKPQGCSKFTCNHSRLAALSSLGWENVDMHHLISEAFP